MMRSTPEPGPPAGPIAWVLFLVVIYSLPPNALTLWTMLDQALPVVEFRKWIYAWTQAGKAIPMTFVYREQVHAAEDIVTDPVWRTRGRGWKMRPMDFQAIQLEGPNQCRW
jgi:hypothetical protein